MKRVFICVKTEENISAILENAKTFSPNIEFSEDDMIVFDLTGSRTAEAEDIAIQIYREHPEASVSISANLASAVLLAERNPGLSIGDQSLLDLPVNALPGKRDFLILMEQWAISDFRAFAKLPEDEMVSRFGQEALRFLKIARGESFRRINWNVKESEFKWSRDFDDEMRNLEPLRFILSGGISILAGNLRNYGLSSQQAKIVLSLKERKKNYDIKTSLPTRRVKLWLRQIMLTIEEDPPKHYFDSVSLEFEPCKPRSLQNNLFSGAIVEPENVDFVVSKLRKLFGKENIGVPHLLDTWDSKPFTLAPDTTELFERIRENKEHKIQPISQAFFFYPQPVLAKIEPPKGIPRVLIIKGKRSKIEDLGGPWRKSFWNENFCEEINEWDMHLESGEILRVSVRKSGEAFVEGGYD